MSLFLTVIDGPDKGLNQPLSPGLVIGRGSKSQFHLKDSKVSSRHARVQKDDQGHWVLHDLGSTNGIKQGQKRCSSLALTPGVQFSIGRNMLQVTEKPTTPSPDKEQKAPTAEAPLEPKTWKDLLETFFMDVASKVKDSPSQLKPLSHPLRLVFHSGVQADQEWLITYAPRSVGASSVDLVILDLEAPNLCFELLPSKKGVQFKTNHPQKVFLNGERIKSDVLKSGDRIRVGKTEIEVQFKK